MSKRKKIAILKDILGEPYLNSEEYLFYCPSCKHHKKKLSVNIAKNVFKCWVCDWSGKNIKRIVRRYGDVNHKVDWPSLENEIDIASFNEQLFATSVTEKEIKVPLPEKFKTLTTNKNSYESRMAIKYLLNRGVDHEDILKWKIGFCNEGKYSNRIIIPSFSQTGHCNYFIARSYVFSNRKYLNPSADKDIIFNHLYIDWDEDLTIVEGVFDAIKAGYNSIPILGSTLREQSKLFQEIVKNDTPVYLALDPDAEKKSWRIIERLLKYGIEVYKINILPYSDVGEMSKGEFKKRKENAELIDSDNYLLHKIMNI
tara:strand:- start:1341 stop:2279 length:939 start_codon:yes stop_codon:yes gene_type:complete